MHQHQLAGLPVDKLVVSVDDVHMSVWVVNEASLLQLETVVLQINVLLPDITLCYCQTLGSKNYASEFSPLTCTHIYFFYRRLFFLVLFSL